MNALCPACRRQYTEEGVVWKPVAAEDAKRVQQQKKRKEKERKELETLGRKSYLDVRIVQRNVAYVVGLGSRFAKEETISVLRSSDYFGRYGKISRIQLQKRTPPGADAPVVGVYITYLRREDAERAIQSIDGSPSPGGGGEVMRASYGTAKYCISFLRNATCTNNNCLDAHEWGEPDDCFTREDLTHLKLTIKDTEKRSSMTIKRSAGPDAPSLPRSASWASRPAQASSSTQASQTDSPSHGVRSSRPTRQSRNVSGPKPPRNDSGDKGSRERDRRKGSGLQPAATAPSILPSPLSQTTTQAVEPPTAPEPAAETSTAASSPQVTASVADSEARSHAMSPPVVHGQPSVPPGLAPPGLAPPGLAPPGLAPPGLVPPPGLSAQWKQGATSSEAVNPAPPASLLQPPGLARPPPGLSLPSEALSPTPSKPYQLSKNAQALINDVVSRREAVKSTPPPIFPDFDRTLSTLVNSAGFSFSFASLSLNTAESGLPAIRSIRKTTFDPFASPLDLTSSSETSSPALRSINGDPRRAMFDSQMSDLPTIGEGGRSRFDFARRQSSLGGGSSLLQSSRGSTPFRPEATSGNTLYNSTDTMAGGRQGNWVNHPNAGMSMEYRYNPQYPVQYQVPLAGPEHPVYNELPPTPFDQAPMAENMRELVRGFETPGIERANNRQLELGLSAQLTHGQNLPYQMQSTVRRDDLASSQRMMTKSPPNPQTNFISYQTQQVTGPPGLSHISQAQQPSASGSGPKELTSPNGELRRLLNSGRVY